jgi:tryptophan synthase alpha chain
MSRIGAKFAEIRAQGRIGLVVFLPVGFPDMDSTLALVPALAAAGADVVELGIPFSDPLADGATIQRASFQALQQGVTLERCLETCQRLRESSSDVPLVLMGYYNPILSYGVERFGLRCASAGVDGVIVADLPPEEANPLHEACLANEIDLIFLLAPTSTAERIERVCQMTSGFVYCVSLTGVTGARRELAPGLKAFVSRVRERTHLPIAVGFGISKREHIEAIGSYADAAVIGGALIDLIDGAPAQERVIRAQKYVQELTKREKIKEE